MRKVSKIKIERITKGITQQELADKADISRSYFSLIEVGKSKNPSIEIMKKISEILETPVQDLFF